MDLPRPSEKAALSLVRFYRTNPHDCPTGTASSHQVGHVSLKEETTKMPSIATVVREAT